MNEEVELVGYATCDGCPGGNVEYTGEEMVSNGAEVIHLATGLVVGYPPCPYTTTVKEFPEARYGVRVVVGTHPIPKKYLDMHERLGTWKDPSWPPLLAPTLADESTRAAYDQYWSGLDPTSGHRRRNAPGRDGAPGRFPVD